MEVNMERKKLLCADSTSRCRWNSLPSTVMVTSANRPSSRHRSMMLFTTRLEWERSFLLGGVELNQDSNIVLLDEEMASMRPGRAFLSRVNNNIPRSLSSMQQMVDVLKSRRKEPMTQDLFESLVLSMVRSAYQTGNQRRPKDREAWGEMLLQLANLTVHELPRAPSASPPQKVK
uniref:Family with sequence similarity 180 member A n=1 Tax=Hippocampus comes TaxID=109280 RepID=A0A3Q2YBE7_HIPCM